MANYYGTTRSNYFRVKDDVAFKDWCNELNLDWWDKTFDSQDGVFYAISADTGDCCGWPTSVVRADPGDPDVENDVEVDVAAELADHLDPRDVAILLEIGSEKLRYLVGTATAVNSEGKAHTISLANIAEEARTFFGAGVNVTEAHY